MNSRIILSGAGFIAVMAVIAVVLMRWPEAGSQKTEAGRQSAQTGVSAPQPAEIRGQDSERLSQRVLAAPQEFHKQSAAVREAPTPLAVPLERPRQLSEIDKSSIGTQQSAMLREPVAASELYFHKDFESLRKEEIRNPDSAENRAGVVAMMKARQRRTGK